MPSARQVLRLLLFAAFAHGLFAAENRISRPVDPGRRITLRRHTSQWAQPRYDRGPAAASTSVPYLTLRLKPAAGLEELLIRQRTPASPDYHRWLTPDEFGDRFGLSTADMAKLTAWLRSEGLHVHDVARGRHWITFSGTVDQLNRAFRAQIHRYLVNGELHIANSLDPSIPEAFADVVSGIDGLDDFGLQPLLELEQSPGASAVPQFTAGSSRYLAPDDFATIYDLTPLYNSGIDGSGQKIAVIGRSAVNLADVRQFRQSFNLPPNDPQLVLYGPNPGITSSVVESNLDIEWAGAVARQAAIIYVYSNNLDTAVQYAVDQNLAPVITFSYGGCEAYNSIALRSIAQQANAQGITWLAASGDWGAATCDLSSPIPQASKGPSATFPASIPEITAVGGTEFNDGNGAAYWAATNTANGASALSYIPERAWNTALVRNDLSSTGGGPSLLFNKPLWQSGPGVPNDNARDIPDVSLAASPQHYPYIMYSGGSTLHVGGTSVSSPAFAGIVALLNHYLVANGTLAQPGLGNINPELYRLAQATTDVFHDIRNGDNFVPCEQSSPACSASGMGFAAGPGYDLATGLGSVDAGHLVAEWKSALTTVTTVVASPSAVSLTDTVTLTATVTGGSGTPTGTVAFLVSDSNVGTAPVNSSGVATLTLLAINLVGRNGTITAAYSGDAVFDGSSGSAAITLNLPASGSLVVPFITPNPVPQAGPFWPYRVTLIEKAGVATTLTSFAVDGVRQSLGLWTSTNIPANGAISASLASSNLNAPVNRVFVFSGQDPDGTAWTRQITVPFLPGPGPTLAPSITLSSSPGVVQQNPQADPTCQWSHQLTIQETGGFLVQLTALRFGSTDLSGQIQQLFGTTRLAPYGMLHANLCWDASTQPGTKPFQLAGLSEMGMTVTADLPVTLAAPAAVPSALSVSPQVVQIPLDSSGQAVPVSIHVNVNGSAPGWTAAIQPANRTTSWLKLSPSNGQVTLLASTAGLANGVYRALVSIEAPGAVPAVITVPVTMIVGASAGITISGIRNNASGTLAFAPGMQIAVYGSGLAPFTQQAGRIPLPFSLAGVSATINGISAPVYFVSPGQINLQIPYETGSGPAVLAVNNNGQVAAFSFPVSVAAPGIFNFFIDNTAGLRNSGAPGHIMTIFASGAGDLAPSLATGATPPAFTPVPGLPAPRLPVTVTVGGEAAAVAFAGNASGLVGAIQINFTVPADLAPGPQPVVVTIGSAASDPVTLLLEAPSGPVSAALTSAAQ